MPLADILYVYIYILYIILKQEANYNIYSQTPLLRKNECKSKDKMYKKTRYTRLNKYITRIPLHAGKVTIKMKNKYQQSTNGNTVNII